MNKELSTDVAEELRDLQKKYNKVRKALADIIGADTEEDLALMEIVIRTADAPERDKAVTLNAVHALQDTMEK